MNKIVSLIAVFFLVVFATMPLHAQKQKKKKVNPHASQIKGDEHFSRYEYYLAAQEYKLVVDEEPDNYYAIFRLAESYREYFEYKPAEKYYKIIIDKAITEYPLARFWYAITLRDNGNYSGAKKQFQLFVTEYHETTLAAEEYKHRARNAIDGLDLAEEEMRKPQRDYTFHCLPQPVNTFYSEYSPVIIGKTDSILVITSSREGSTGHVENNMLGGAMSDSYRFVYDGVSAWIPYVPEDNFAVS